MYSEAVTYKYSIKKVFLKIPPDFVPEKLCTRVSFLIKLQVQSYTCNFIEQGALTEVFSYEFCEVFKNTFSTLLDDCFFVLYAR